MSFDDATRMRCNACGAIWLKPEAAPAQDPSDQCLRCEGALVVDK